MMSEMTDLDAPEARLEMIRAVLVMIAEGHEQPVALGMIIWNDAGTAPRDGTIIIGSFAPFQTGNTERRIVRPAVWNGGPHPWTVFDDQTAGLLNKFSDRCLREWISLPNSSSGEGVNT
jgi:hypothetical protein